MSRQSLSLMVMLQESMMVVHRSFSLSSRLLLDSVKMRSRPATRADQVGVAHHQKWRMAVAGQAQGASKNWVQAPQL